MEGRMATLAPLRQLTDAEGLAIELLNTVAGEVRFDTASRALYATDASNYRQVPIGVVLPRDAADVEATIAACRAFGAPILSRGGGTSLAGQCCNVAVVMDHSKYNNRLLELNAAEHWARVQPGLVLDRLREAAGEHGLTFGPDPATHNHCTLGGMIGNNSCGAHSVMAGKTVDNVLELDVLTYDGTRLTVGPTSPEEIAAITANDDRRGQVYRAMASIAERHADEIRARYPDIPRRVSGYNLDSLLPENGFDVARALVGSESTLMTVLEAKVRLVPEPPAKSLVVLGFATVFDAGDAVPDVMASKPIACEGMDRALVDDARLAGVAREALSLLPQGDGFLLVEFGGADQAEADARAEAMLKSLRRSATDGRTRLLDRHEEEEQMWQLREAGLGATAFAPGKPVTEEGWEDSAVPPERFGEYLRAISNLAERYGVETDMYGHFGQGLLHARFNFDLRSARGVRRFREFVGEAADVVVSMGGSLSGEHGDGQSRAELLPKMFGPQIIGAFEEFKDAWDPAGMMNPGKVVRPNPITSHLRLGPDYDPPRVATHYTYLKDEGSFAHAAYRCVGIGECRKDEGTMCPSYMVTRDELHSTRGRAHLLFEMMRGARPQPGAAAGDGPIITDGWRSEEVHQALELCLSCKACKSECPTGVDMATLKSEFLSHYWAGRLRSRAAYAFGLMPWWLKLGGRLPGLANFATQTRGLATLAKLAAGVARERTIPRLAPQTFSDWFATRHAPARYLPNGRVVLWPDTFTDHFHPDTARAAVEVLEAAGYSVELPSGWVCCGRPLYDFGFIGQARGLLKRAMKTLGPALRQGVPIIGLEPSCMAAFRDELTELFPGRAEAQRLHDGSFLLTEFLARHAPGYAPPRMHGRAIVHGHCQQKAVLDFDGEVDLLRRTGLDLEVLDSGCCGMAGAFGFEAGEKYEVSVKAAERVLLPKVRGAPSNTWIITPGFSCREQIGQLSERAAIHPAEVLAAGLRQAEARSRPPTAARTSNGSEASEWEDQPQTS
jgi:FAD/FMN-containing dehydrogenase/Fe-S oxidoreductase